MKTILTAVLALSLLFSCKKDNDVASASEQITLGQQLTSSPWDVHYFFYNTEQTKAFQDYSFVFKQDSTVVFTNLSSSYQGGWSVGKESDGSLSVSISLRTVAPAQLVNNKWRVTGNTGTMLTLKDYEGDGNGELHIQKR